MAFAKLVLLLQVLSVVGLISAQTPTLDGNKLKNLLLGVVEKTLHIDQIQVSCSRTCGKIKGKLQSLSHCLALMQVKTRCVKSRGSVTRIVLTSKVFGLESNKCCVSLSTVCFSAEVRVRDLPSPAELICNNAFLVALAQSRSRESDKRWF